MTGRIMILAFAFGAPENIKPNRLIAHRVNYLSLPDKWGVDIFTQKDVPLDQMNPIFAENVTAKKGYFSTLNVVQAFVNWIIVSSIRGEEWSECIIVAAPQHQWRCCRDLKKVSKERGLTMKMKIIIDDELEFKNMYDKYSHQWWTRSWWQWWLREIPLRLLPWWLYKKIA